MIKGILKDIIGLMGEAVRNEKCFLTGAHLRVWYKEVLPRSVKKAIK